ncbi:MAG TPA: DUF3105 domain-containing protein [bacterium]|nr:DUF3105 domain-containing protein [bacterium]
MQPSRAERRRLARKGGGAPPGAAPAVLQNPKPASSHPARARRRGVGRTGVWWLVGAVALIVIIAAVWWGRSSRSAAQPGSNTGDRVAYEGNTHVPIGSPIQYQAHPPASGNHYPNPAPPGVYPAGILPGFWVHSLEHGYVVLAYKPPATPQLLGEFDAMVKDFPKSKYGYAKLVIVPYTEMDHPFAVLAWTWRLWLDTFDRQRVLDFYRAHVDRGPEDVP